MTKTCICTPDAWHVDCPAYNDHTNRVKAVDLKPSYYTPNREGEVMYGSWPTWKEKCEECGVSLAKKGLCGECLELGKLETKLASDEDNAVERWREENEETNQ